MSLIEAGEPDLLGDEHHSSGGGDRDEGADDAEQSGADEDRDHGEQSGNLHRFPDQFGDQDVNRHTGSDTVNATSATMIPAMVEPTTGTRSRIATSTASING